MTELSKHREFRSSEGGVAASVVSAQPKVRAALLKMQQDFAKNPSFADGSTAKGAIYDGRDTGTVVCPQADIKFSLPLLRKSGPKDVLRSFRKKASTRLTRKFWPTSSPVTNGTRSVQPRR